MLVTTSLLAFSALLHQALAIPNNEKREGIAGKTCNRDNLYRSFIDPRSSASASSFCSTYIRSTVSTVATATATVSAVKRGLEDKRDLPATTQFPASRLSSACSCILTATPTPTTVYTATVTTTTTVGAGSCTVATPIVKNGNFESGLAPWTVATVIPDPVDYAQYISFGVKSPGYNSANAFTVTDDLASSYFELDLTQDIALCPGKKYNFAAKFYMTDSKNIPTKETYLTIFVNDVRIDGSTFADGIGPPIVWKSLTGSFTATGSSATLRAAFVATNFVGVTWGIDNVVITPA